MPPEIINKSVFRAYDIRGQIGKEWCIGDDDKPVEKYHDAFLIGQSIGSQLVKRQSPHIIIGRDGRLSSAPLTTQLIQGLLSVGCHVTDIGVTATPVVYFALSHLSISNSVMVTGSHNPPDHNGIKIVYENSPISRIVIESLFYDITGCCIAESKQPGKYQYYENIIQDYQQAILENISLKRSLRVGIDCCNGATSLFAESLFTQLGCEIHPLFCELDGTFPNHSPDPTVPANLKALSRLVIENDLDLGLAFDGDGDRVIAVDNKGKILWPDRIMILLAQDMLKQRQGARVVFDVKCSYLLPQAVSKAGGQPSMCISGHSILKMQMMRLNAAMGGEFSGHIVMRDRWSDFDDGPYVAARLLEVIAKAETSPEEIFKKIPDSYSTPEYKLNFEHSDLAVELLDQFIQCAAFPGANLSLIDGLRVDYEDGWGLVRSSNTSASLTFRFEAVSQERLEEIQNQFREVFNKTDNTQTLPF